MDRNKFKIFNDFCSSIKKGDTEKAIAKGEEVLEISHRLTVFDDTILHIAIYMGSESIAKEILKKYRNNLELLKMKNALGDTILHEAAATNMTSFAKLILKLAPELLDIGNQHGEKPLFRAALYGRAKMFELLADVIGIKQENPESYYKRDDGETILHMTILAEFYDLARKIAERYPDLVDAEDRYQMIGFQLLSSNPSACKCSRNYGLLESFFSSKDTKSLVIHVSKACTTIMCPTSDLSTHVSFPPRHKSFMVYKYHNSWDKIVI